jgi:NHLM bacteriocin system ABC transporter peptidase/ATP-binding protein
MEAVECGAAALAIVLGYHGKFISLEELRVACGVSRDGTDAGNLVKAAARYGLKARGYNLEPADLSALPLPLVVFWSFNHFVVVEGFRKGRVYLNDPARGPTWVSDAEFSENFTGVVLVFERGPDFQPGGQPRGLIRPLRQRLAGSEVGLLFVVLASLLLVLPGLVAPIFTQIFVDRCLVAGRTDWVLPLLGGMALAAALRAGLTWLQRRSLLRLETKLALTSSYRFFRHLLRLPVEFFTHRYRGEISSRVAINDRIAVLLSGDLAWHLLNALVALLYLILMLCYDLLLTCVGVLIAGLNVLALHYVARHRRDVNLRLLQERGKLMGTSMAGLQAIETLKATGGESDFFSRWAGLLARVMVAEQKLSLSTLFLRAVPPLLASLGTVAILGLGSLRVMTGALSIGALVAFQSFMASFLAPVGELIGLGASLQEVEGQVNRLDDVLRAPVAPDFSEDKIERQGDKPSSVSLSPKLAGQLEMRNITFGYSILDRPLIEGFNLKVKPGARVALVGPSASGKSTVAKLIAGLYQPWSGEILLDGRPRAQVARAVLCSSLAMVDQDFFLFEGTVREVLTLWYETVSEEDVIQAAKDACIHEDIAARPGGYRSKVDEGGRNFSGGQRQRLEIARALAGNPSLLVLDEATSALDPVTEKQIDDNLRRRGCTCVIIAHRLSTIRDCDEIIVMDQGKIVQRGTHDELCAADGPYQRLISA